MNGILERSMAIIELLSRHGQGMELGAIAEQLDIPRSAVHRLLAGLIRLDYVRQARGRGDYMLTTKLVSLGLSYLSHSGITDSAQPILNRLAEVSGELVRLSVVDGDRLAWVGRAQGATQGLRYDPDMGSDAQLSCTSSGWAWLSTLDDDQAMTIVAKQGLGKPGAFGPNAPTTLQAVLDAVRVTRERGYSITFDTYGPGVSAMSTPVRTGREAAIGVLTISGPSVRMTEQRMHELLPELQTGARLLAVAAATSPFFRLAAGADSPAVPTRFAA